MTATPTATPRRVPFGKAANASIATGPAYREVSAVFHGRNATKYKHAHSTMLERRRTSRLHSLLQVES